MRYTMTVKPVLSGYSKKDQNWVFKTYYHLMQVKSIAECSKGSILQYFRPSLSFICHEDLCFLYFCGRLRQVLLYKDHLFQSYKKAMSV